MVLLSTASQAWAQTATVNLSTQKQYIRGYGGMNHAAWAGDMTAAERTLAFGNAAGQLGLTILRIPVTDGSPDSVNVATAKAAIANGAIVFATPWNAAHTYTSSDFASYVTHLNNFVSYMSGQGVNLYAISVQNEPDYGATAGWGSWSASACHDFVLNYGAQVTGTKLMSCESFNYAKGYYDPILNDSAALANVDVFGTHLYGTAVSAYSYPNFASKGGGKEMWMTEHYTDSSTDANSWPNALGVATELHNSMVTGQFNAYTWWYIKRSYGYVNSGAVTKRGWCMAHWSKFVRPGFYRVDATAAPASNVLLSAYTGNSSVVIVIVNNNTSTSSLNISVNGSTVSSYSKYTTSSSKSLTSDGTVTASSGSLSVSLDASSVTTLYGTGNSATGGTGTGGAGTGGSSTGGKATGGASTGGTSTGGKATGGTSTGGTGTGGTSTGGKATGGLATGGQASGGLASGGKATGGTSSATGGSSQTGGTSSQTGGTSSATGGTSSATGGTATGGSGTSSGTGGTTSAGGTGGSGGTPEGQGCSCRTVPSEGGSGKLLRLIGLCLVALRRRRASPTAR
jgi:glucuronoarabinoxylan endo-1,4-beta-xylanase